MDQLNHVAEILFIRSFRADRPPRTLLLKQRAVKLILAYGIIVFPQSRRAAKNKEPEIRK